MSEEKNKTGQAVSVKQRATSQTATPTAVPTTTELNLEAYGLHQANGLNELPSGPNAQILRQTAVMGMQGRLGNQQIQRMLAQQHKVGNHHTPVSLRPPTIQTKLTVNEPDDSFEKEADEVADGVMKQPSAAPPPPMPTQPNTPPDQAQRASARQDVQRKEGDAPSNEEEASDTPTPEEKAKALAAAEQAKKVATQARVTGQNEVKKSETQEGQAETAGQ